MKYSWARRKTINNQSIFEGGHKNKIKEYFISNLPIHNAFIHNSYSLHSSFAHRSIGKWKCFRDCTYSCRIVQRKRKSYKKHSAKSVIWSQNMVANTCVPYGCHLRISVVMMRQEAVWLIWTSPVISPTSPNVCLNSLYFWLESALIGEVYTVLGNISMIIKSCIVTQYQYSKSVYLHKKELCTCNSMVGSNKSLKLSSI